MLSGRLLDYGIPKMQENEASIDRTRSRGTYAAPRSVRQLDPHAIVAAVIFVAVIGLAIWYLARPAPLLVKHRNLLVELSWCAVSNGPISTGEAA